MTNSEWLDRLDHDLSAAIRNFRVTDGLLTGERPDVAFALELLRASIEQLEATRQGLVNTELRNNFDNKPSQCAQK